MQVRAKKSLEVHKMSVKLKLMEQSMPLIINKYPCLCFTLLTIVFCWVHSVPHGLLQVISRGLTELLFVVCPGLRKMKRLLIRGQPSSPGGAVGNVGTRQPAVEENADPTQTPVPTINQKTNIVKNSATERWKMVCVKTEWGKRWWERGMECVAQAIMISNKTNLSGANWVFICQYALQMYYFKVQWNWP